MDTPSRRSLLRTAAAGVAAVVGIALRPRTARAADGDAVVLGQENTANNATVIQSASGGPALKGISSTDDGALVGESTASDGYGVRASGPYIGLNALGGQIAVYAVSDAGKGVHALTYDGVAISAATAVDAGTALQVDGRAAFKWSGRAVVPAGARSVTVTGVPLTAESLVLATLQQRRDDTHVEAAVPDPVGARFTVSLNRRTSRNLTIAWFVIN